MPSIDTTRNKDSSLEQISSVISVELDGQNPTTSAPSKVTTGSVNGATTYKLCEEGSQNTTTMAPYKNGTIEQSCKKTNQIAAQSEEHKVDVEVSIDNETSAKGDVTSLKHGASCHSNSDGVHTDIVGSEGAIPKNGETSGLVDREDENDGAGKSTRKCEEKKIEGGHQDKTADEKRKEYKDKPKASSVEILGLKKRNAKLKSQGYLPDELCEAFQIVQMKRRKSAPSRLPEGRLSSVGQRKSKIDEEEMENTEEGQHKNLDDSSTGALASNVETNSKMGDQKGSTDMDNLVMDFGKKVGLQDQDRSTKPGFAQRMESEQTEQSTNLISKGPTRQQQCAHRVTPYSNTTQPLPQPAGQAHFGQGNTYQIPTQTFVPDLPRTQLTVCSSMTKVAIPGMKPQPKIVTVPPPEPFDSSRWMIDAPTFQQLPAGYTVQNQHHRGQQVMLGSGQISSPAMVGFDGGKTGGREPEESLYHWPPSPTDGSSYSDPNSPASAGSYSPEHMQTAPSPASTSSMINSPKSAMSPEGQSNMSMSPGSPYTVVSPPPSVGSNDSGCVSCTSPSHDIHTTSAGMNSGTVFVNNNFRSSLDNQLLPEQSRPCLPRGLIKDENDKERRVNEIAKSLEQYADAILDSNVLNARNVDIPQNMNPLLVTCGIRRLYQSPVRHEHMLRQPMQQVQPPSLETIVSTMPLDLLCSQDEDEDTALHIAISQGHESLSKAIIGRLVQNGRREALNIKDKLGQTPLYVAVVMNQPVLVLELLKNGADVMIPNKENTTPLHYVATKGYANALKGICYGVLEGHHSNVNFNVENKNGMSPLQCAVQAHGRFEQVYDGNQCTYVNKLVDSTDTLKVLLYFVYADTSFQDSRSGKTALHYAVELKPNSRVTTNTFIIQLILESCSDAQELVAKTTYGGNTPLHLIAGLDYKEDYIVSVIDLLLSCGADINAQNAEKIKPHDLVDKEKRKKVYSRLQGDHMQGKC